MNTTSIRKKDIKNKWHLLDAKGKPLGRIATEVASLLLGKHNPSFSPRIVSGDKVVVINSDKLKLTGNKLIDKKYYTHSGYAGGLKERNAEYYMDKDSTYIIRNAVKGMLPVNKIRKKRLLNLYIYKGSEHPHQGQVK